MGRVRTLLVLALGACGPASPAPGSAEETPHPSLEVWDFLRERYDRNGDARIEPAEYARGERAFGYVDADADGAITAADFGERWGDGPREAGFALSDGPAPGDPAPELSLTTTSGEPVALSALRGTPVALVFGSFT
jgi:hypothetical protein